MLREILGLKSIGIANAVLLRVIVNDSRGNCCVQRGMRRSRSACCVKITEDFNCRWMIQGAPVNCFLGKRKCKDYAVARLRGHKVADRLRDGRLAFNRFARRSAAAKQSASHEEKNEMNRAKRAVRDPRAPGRW